VSRRKPKGKLINGIILLDKPQGVTSNRALQKVKGLFQAQKAGHTGSLDPLATGLLPICLGEATKISGFLLDAYKSYHVRCQLGICTDSGDADGQIIEQNTVPNFTENQILAVLEKFIGEIEQIPPMHSALKKDGVPLYKLAHKGISIKREPRQLTIKQIDMTRKEGHFLEFFVHCSKGTYIRTLIEDIGAELGCGAYVVELRRLLVGPFDATDDGGSEMYTLAELERFAAEPSKLRECLLDIDCAIDDWPKVELGKEASFCLQQGQEIFVPGIKGNGLVRLYSQESGFLGIGEFNKDGKIKPKRLMVTAKIG